MSQSRIIQQSKTDKIFDLFSYVFLTIILFAILYPLIYIVSTSFSSPTAVAIGRVWLYPVDFSLKGYQSVFRNSQVWTGYANSIFYTLVGTAINILVTVLAAYPLSRKGMVGRKPIMFLFTFTMLF